MNRLVKHRWQFGLLGLCVVVAMAAISFAFLQPRVFPSDDLIRRDLAIPRSIKITVFDRQTVNTGNAVQYWATVHVAERPHRLVRAWCKASGPLAERAKWEPFHVHDYYDNGTSEFRVCERLYDKPPTKAELAEFREFAANFR